MDSTYNNVYGDSDPNNMDFVNSGPSSRDLPFDAEPRMTNRTPMRPIKQKGSEGGSAIIFVIIGILLIFLGSVFGGATWVIEEPDYDDYDDDYNDSDYDKARETYNRVIRWFTFINEIFWVAGALTLSGGLIGVALLKDNINPQTKIGLLIGAALIIGFMMMNRTGMFGVISLLNLY